MAVEMGCVFGMRLGWEECWFLRSDWGVMVLLFVGCLGVVGDLVGCGMALGSFLRKLSWMAWAWETSFRVR